MKFLAKIFLILTFILTSCKNKEAIENDRTLESKTSITQSTEESKSADLYLKDASFLRLKEIEIGYTLTKDITKFADVKSNSYICKEIIIKEK